MARFKDLSQTNLAIRGALVNLVLLYNLAGLVHLVNQIVAVLHRHLDAPDQLNLVDQDSLVIARLNPALLEGLDLQDVAANLVFQGSRDVDLHL